ncbi:MAG: ribosome maturation factor RimP [Acidobacteria bacterium]|nr:ribosome maturation factor RimP [Acidobacteriota bacterium]
MTTTEHIAELVAPVLADTEHSLYDIELAGATVRVLIDGASLEDLQRLSPLISEALDDDDLMPARWYLEVSSPGLERTLRRPEHFTAAIGSQVKIKTTATTEGERRVDGVLESADEQGVTVAGRTLAYGEIERARTVFEWGASQKPARPAKPRPAGARTRRAS